MQNDTIELLKECNSGSKMAVSAIDELMDKTESGELHHMLVECKDRHTKLGNELHELLNIHGEKDQEINPIAKAMSWVSTNVKMATEHSDNTVAEIMIDGCNMGVKSLCKYYNKYNTASEKSKGICQKLIGIEDNFAVSLRQYL